MSSEKLYKVVWLFPHNKKRYLKKWNPLVTKASFHDKESLNSRTVIIISLIERAMEC